MLKEERQKIILTEVRIHNRVLLTDLSEKLNVSIDTVRRDVKELDSNNELKKVHGGAISLGFNNDKSREVFSYEEKSKIAQKAIGLLKDGQVILITGGTTNLEFIRMIPPKMNLTFFTPSLRVATQLLSHPSSEVIFIGGKLSKEAQITVGGETVNGIAQIQADICFLGTGYLDITHGLTEFDWDVVQVKKAMIKAAKKTVLLSISEKLNSSQYYKTCDINEIDVLITELDVNHEKLADFKKQNIELL
ncbi:DeoR/GlpR family DNA-binding transcription regulator [Zhouia sp. PK063]|uniref:DeoR/GlpR family DNA-binding transcription regulator n=1 Tax=Zhouia sp. PK063 TaxID=3373602 RepID=UPI0037BD1125